MALTISKKSSTVGFYNSYGFARKFEAKNCENLS